MSNARLVHDADKAANEALQLLSSLESVYRDLESCPCKLSRNSDYVSYDAMHGSILPEGDDQNDVVKQRVDCVNVAIFTNAMWSNSVQYNEAIPIFFPLLIPKHLHDREGIVGLFLDMVTLWAFTETRWPIGKLTLRHVISKVEGKIEVVLKDEDPLLCQKIWATFHARYDHLDLLSCDLLEGILNPKHLREVWFRVLPTVLEAIDNNKEGGHQQAEESGSDNDGRFGVENVGSVCSFGATYEGSVNDDGHEDPVNELDVPESCEGKEHQQKEPDTEAQRRNKDSGELFDTSFDSWHQGGNAESGSSEDTYGLQHRGEDTHELQHREEDFHVERVAPSQTTTEPVEQYLTGLESEPQVHHGMVSDDGQPNDSNSNNDEDTTGWVIQGSNQEDFDISPMYDLHPSRCMANNTPRINAASPPSSFNFSMDPSPTNAHTVISPTQEEGANQKANRQEPNESHAGMKRPHYQDDGSSDQAEKSYRRDPSFISDIFDNEARQGSPEDTRYELADDDDSSNADIEDSNGIFHPLTPSHHSNAQPQSTTSTPLVVHMPPFNILGSLCNHTNANDRPQNDDDDHNVHMKAREDVGQASTHCNNDSNHCITNLDSTPHIKTEDETIHAGEHNDNTMENGNPATSQQQQTLCHDGLAYTIHSVPESPEDHPPSSNVGAYDATHNGNRDDHTQQALFGFGNTTTRQQEDDHANNLSSTSVTASPVTPRRRRRRFLHRRHYDIGPTIASTRPRRSNAAYTFQPPPTMVPTFRRWTAEEVKALDDGIKLYGRQWGKIVAEYSILRSNKTKHQASRKARYIAQQKRMKGLPLEHYEGCG